ncbi:MAG: PAS-domain containing protein [Holosporales bacterium]|nr:PAS-domain containing protein [Holosporales bacterium]
MVLSKLPVPFAAWVFDGGEVFVSDDLKNILHAPETGNFLSPYQFVKLCRTSFGDFLKTAVDEVSVPQSSKNVIEYSSIYSQAHGDKLPIRLLFFSKFKTYILLINISSNESNRILNTILDSLPLYIWQKNRDLSIIYCNKTYADALETSKDAVIAKNLNLLTTPRYNSFSSAAPNHHSLRSKKFSEHIVINGDLKLLDVTELPFGGNASSISFAIDVTATEVLQKEFEDYRKQMEETLDNISIPIAILDEHTKLVFANETFIKLFGSGWQGDYFGKKFADILDPLFNNGTIVSFDGSVDYKEQFKQLFLNIIEPYHTSLHLKDGKFMNINISPNRGGGLIVICEDISDKVALEREVHSISAAQRETLGHLKEGVIVFGSDIRIKMTNPASKSLWNVSDASNVIGLHVRDFFKMTVGCFGSTSEAEKFAEDLINIAIQRVEFSTTTSLSNGKTIDYSYVPLPDGFHLIRFFNATDRANLEKALTEKTEIISKVDYLKERIISNISLALRGPLSTIMGFSDILGKKYFGEINDKQLRYFQGIIDSAKKLDEIIGTITNLSSLEAGRVVLNRKEVFISDFVRNSIEFFNERVAEHGTIFSPNLITDDEAIVLIDEDAMKQAIFYMLERITRLYPQEKRTVVHALAARKHEKEIEIIIEIDKLDISEDEINFLQQSLRNSYVAGKTIEPSEFGIILAAHIIRLHNGRLTILVEEEKPIKMICQIPTF